MAIGRKNIKRYKTEQEIRLSFRLKSGEYALVRNMVLDDVPAVHELECLVFQDSWSLSAFRHELVRSSVSWPLVVEIHYEIVGYAIPWYIADEMHLANIAVSPVYRRKGIAEYLVIIMLDKAIQKSVHRVFLEVRPSNSGAIRMYEKLGFEKIGFRHRYYRNGEDALVMQRFLSNQDSAIKNADVL